MDLDREKFQDVFYNFLEKGNFDCYGIHNGQEDDLPSGGFGFENNTFIIRPYYWGDDDDIAELPNFVYKPLNLEIKWYKYALRSAFCNQDITPYELANILDDCLRSLGVHVPSTKEGSIFTKVYLYKILKDITYGLTRSSANMKIAENGKQCLKNNLQRKIDILERFIEEKGE